MLFSIYRRRVSTTCKRLFSLVLHEESGPYCVRRNASNPFWCSDYRLFSEKSSSGLSDDETLAVDDVEKTRNSEAIKAMLRDYGCSDTQIARVVRYFPKVLSASSNNILPKLEFFSSIFLPSNDLPVIISRDPTVLMQSLKKKIIPSYDYLKNLGLGGEALTRVVKRSPRFLTANVKTILAPNIELLRGVGVSESSILTLIKWHPYALHNNHEKFKGIVEQLISTGVHPWMGVFVQGINVLSGVSKETWDKKVKLYRGLGLSDDEIMLAFRKYPICMALSEKKISRTMDFFVNKMRCEARLIARRPQLLAFNLENRIIPRLSILQVLVSMGVIEREERFRSFVEPTEKKFLETILARYEKQVPGLCDFYKGKIGIEELPYLSAENG